MVSAPLPPRRLLHHILPADQEVAERTKMVAAAIKKIVEGAGHEAEAAAEAEAEKAARTAVA